jgi:hypothetical protein
MRCSDGEFYVVKFQNNPQHPRVLANEMLAAQLGRCLGLPLMEGVVVQVDPWLVHNSPGMTIQLAQRTIGCHAGLEFGSRLAVKPTEGQIYDYLPPEQLTSKLTNLDMFSSVLMFDKWLGNADGRQAAFWRRARERKYQAAFIDQGYCFNGGEWTFPDNPLRGVFACNEVYRRVTGWESFEPCLSSLETITEEAVLDAAAVIPGKWYGNDWGTLKSLVVELSARKKKVCELITQFRLSPRRPFPNWEP